MQYRAWYTRGMTVITDKETKENLAANVLRLLKSRRINQSELARLSGERVMMISRVCRAQHVPLATVLVRLAEALDVSIDRLLAPPPEFSKK